jgi:hypothetical protein
MQITKPKAPRKSFILGAKSSSFTTIPKRTFFDRTRGPIGTLETVPLRKGGSNKGKGGKSKKGDDEETTEVVEFDIIEVKPLFEGPVHALKKEFENLRISRANPGLLSNIAVTTDNGSQSLSQLGQIIVKDPQLLHVTLYEEKVNYYFYINYM